MKISRASNEKNAPSWFYEGLDENSDFAREFIPSDKAKELSVKINETELVSQRERIEKCVNSNKPYHYNADWDGNIKSELKEYAMACGMDMNRFKAVKTDDMEKVANMNKEVKETRKESESFLGDAFKIDEKLNKITEQENWEEIKTAKTLNEKPKIDAGIVAIRGGEDSRIHQSFNSSDGINSIANPDSIKNAIEKGKEDTGVRLKREKAEREAAKANRHHEWEEKKIKAMKNKNIVQDRKVFPTEVLNAQPGIRGEVFDFDSLPDRTDGENLKIAQEDRRKAIRGEDRQKHEFGLDAGTRVGISDSFAEELKKHIK